MLYLRVALFLLLLRTQGALHLPHQGCQVFISLKILSTTFQTTDEKTFSCNFQEPNALYRELWQPACQCRPCNWPCWSSSAHTGQEGWTPKGKTSLKSCFKNFQKHPKILFCFSGRPDAILAGRPCSLVSVVASIICISASPDVRPSVCMRIKHQMPTKNNLLSHCQVGGKNFQGNQTEEEGLVNRTDSSDEEDSSFDLIN